MEADKNFEITFACAEPMDGKKLKRAIDNYIHDLAPGTTKQIKDKYPDNDSDDGVSFHLDNRTKRFDIGFKIYKVFDNREYKGKIIRYNSQQ